MEKSYIRLKKSTSSTSERGLDIGLVLKGDVLPCVTCCLLQEEMSILSTIIDDTAKPKHTIEKKTDTQ
jgi:hypothetical protein